MVCTDVNIIFSCLTKYKITNTFTSLLGVKLITSENDNSRNSFPNKHTTFCN